MEEDFVEVREEGALFCISYRLIKTTKRLTFDILWQRPETKYQGDDDGPYYVFKASNGYEVYSRSVMDIQTERIWLLGASTEDRAERSGSMVFGSNEKRDKAFDEFNKALVEWDKYWMEKLYPSPEPTVTLIAEYRL